MLYHFSVVLQNSKNEYLLGEIKTPDSRDFLTFIDLVRDIESHNNPQDLKSELEMLIVDISEYSSDDRTIGVVRYERKNAEPSR